MMADTIENKREILVAMTRDYLAKTLPAITMRWKATTGSLHASMSRELTGCMQALVAITNEANRELGDAHCAASEGHMSAEPLLDHAIASLEHLNEIAEAMARRLDEVKAITSRGPA